MPSQIGRPRFDSLPKPPPQGSAWSREFVALLIECMESSTREELEQVAGLVASRHVWPTYSALTMLRAMQREFTRMHAPPPRRRRKAGKQSDPKS